MVDALARACCLTSHAYFNGIVLSSLARKEEALHADNCQVPTD